MLFLLFVLLPYLAEAGVLKGKVTDNKGARLPFATIFIEGTTMGECKRAMATMN
jgi:hypothetical protein